MRLVLDTNAVASGLLWSGPPATLLHLERGPGLKFFTSIPLLEELYGILSRAKFQKKIAASLLSVEQLVTLYAQIVSMVRPLETEHITRDPEDDVVIGTALSAKADLIVSGDEDLLVLGKYQNCKIVNVATALHILSLK